MRKSVIATSFFIFAGALAFVVSCATDQGVTAAWRSDQAVFVDTDTRPTAVFKRANVKSVAVMYFDAKSVRTYGGKTIDYIKLGKDFTDDVLKSFYTRALVKVATGEYEDTIVESDVAERKSGDLDIRTSTTRREITYRAVPYKKIDAILSGRIEKFDESTDFQKSFIEVTFRLIGAYDGEVYWVARMRGFYKDVIATLVESISKGEYIEPSAVVSEPRITVTTNIIVTTNR